jgi:flagellar protein FlaG
VTRLDGARSEQVAAVVTPPPLGVSRVPTAHAQPEVEASARALAVAPVTAEAVEPKQPASIEQLKQATAQIDSFLKKTQRNLEFRIDENTGKVVVSVLDTATGEVVRQIPGDEVLRLAQHLDTSNTALIDIQA